MATALLHLSWFRIVHSDVKPDNIMPVDWRQQPITVCLIDFVSSFFFHIQHYRDPEIHSRDMWSIGATVIDKVITCTIIIIIIRSMSQAKSSSVTTSHQMRFWTMGRRLCPTVSRTTVKSTGCLRQKENMKKKQAPGPKHSWASDWMSYPSSCKKTCQKPPEKAAVAGPWWMHHTNGDHAASFPHWQPLSESTGHRSTVSLPDTDEHWCDLSLDFTSRQLGAQWGSLVWLNFPVT